MGAVDQKRRGHRKYQRVSQNMAIELRFCTSGVVNPQAPPIRGVVTDIGFAGIHVLLGTAYYAGTRFEASLTIDGVPIVFFGTVKHVRWFCGTPGLEFGHGIQITQVDETTLYTIVDYVHRQIAMAGGQPVSNYTSCLTGAPLQAQFGP